eukprot:116277-Pyramimonas_sp.AAC.2
MSAQWSPSPSRETHCFCSVLGRAGSCELEFCSGARKTQAGCIDCVQSSGGFLVASPPTLEGEEEYVDLLRVKHTPPWSGGLCTQPRPI